MEKRFGIIKRESFLVNFIAFIFALRCLYYVWLAFDHAVYFPMYEYLMIGVRYLSVALGILYIFSSNSIDKRNLCLLVPLLSYFIILVIHTYGGYRGNYLDELVCIGCFLLMDSSMKKRVLFIFYKIILYSCLISIVLYLLYLVNIPIGFKSLPFLTEEGLSSVHTEYQQWFIFALLGNRQYGLVRLCGLFNEPGALATVCSLLYVIMYKSSRRFEKIVLLASIVLSFSLAGYLMIFIFYVLYYMSKNWKYSLVAIILIILLFILPQIDFKNDYINAFFQRFVITSDGLAGNNRTDAIFDADFSNFLKSDNVLFGYGARYSPAGSSSSTYKIYILQFGFIGFVTYFGMWLFISLYKSQKSFQAIILIIIFFASIYQRPMTIINSYGYLVMFGGIEWIKCCSKPLETKQFIRVPTKCIYNQGVTDA